jgi:hypothetical protein
LRPAGIPWRALRPIKVEGADYPFMLSQRPKTKPKTLSLRALHAESSTHAAVERTSHSVGNTTVTVTETESSSSELSASTKLCAQVQRRDAWIGLDRARWTATDDSTYDASSSDRKLWLDASAQSQSESKP